MPAERSLDLNELARRIENLVRAGTVAQVDHAAQRCRVQSGGLHTGWLPFFQRRAGDVRHWSPPSAGEQCTIVSPGGDLSAGMVLVGGIYSDDIPAPSASPTEESTTYPDGATIAYDHAAHALIAVLPGGGTADITAPASVTVHSAAITLDAPHTTCTGRLDVSGLFTYMAGMAGRGIGAGAAAVIQGTVQATGDVIAGDVSLTSHVHGGVDPGGSSTSPPTGGGVAP